MLLFMKPEFKCLPLLENAYAIEQTARAEKSAI